MDWFIIGLVFAVICWVVLYLNKDDEFCPTCGYLCTGKGGIGCMDKPHGVVNESQE